MIAALFVQRGGAYFGLPDIDPWDEQRDARLYQGTAPVLAHPPCARWCRLAGLVQARWGLKIGDDGGCFASALANVRRCGGVLEHPAYSLAWTAYGLPKPDRKGGWVQGICGGWSCHVEQIHYGHRARKATWLYVHGINPEHLPDLAWGPGSEPELYVSSCSKIGDGSFIRRRSGKLMSQREASATPASFKVELIRLALLSGRETRGAYE